MHMSDHTLNYDELYFAHFIKSLEHIELVVPMSGVQTYRITEMTVLHYSTRFSICLNVLICLYDS